MIVVVRHRHTDRAGGAGIVKAVADHVTKSNERFGQWHVQARLLELAISALGPSCLFLSADDRSCADLNTVETKFNSDGVYASLLQALKPWA